MHVCVRACACVCVCVKVYWANIPIIIAYVFDTESIANGDRFTE